MKKGLKIAGIVLAVLLVLMISIPFLFKGKIKDAVIKTANDNLNAEFNIGDFGLNLFSNFPNATLSLDDVYVKGIDDFKADTLFKAKSASATINLMSLFKGNYEVSKIELNEADVYAKILANGRANWDIMKPDSAKSESEKESSFRLGLQKVILNDCNVIYNDQVGNMRVVLQEWNGTLSGDFTADETTIKTKSTIKEVSFSMGGIPYLINVKGAADATLKADLNSFKFIFEESMLQLNEVKAKIDGSIAVVGETGMDFDLKLNAPDTQFKDILSIFPNMYTEDFKDVKTEGTASLDGFVKGLMDETNYPAFDLKFVIANAMFQYPSLPKSVNNINVDLSVTNKGGSLDNTVIDISKFTFNMGGNPFSAQLNIQTPISDAALKAHLDGIIDLGMIKEIYPLDKGTELNGRLTANLDIATRMSYIEKEQYENVTAAGHLKLNNMLYKSSDMQDVVINDAALEFSPKYVNLTSLNLKIGQNDLSATGRLENFIAYALKDQTLKGQLDLKSNYFNLNDFMGSDSQSSTAADTSSVGAFVVPRNIDFTLNATFNKVLYEKITLTNVNGVVLVKNGAVTMKDVIANALGGTFKVNGSYDTGQNPTKPKVDFSMALTQVSFAETFKSVEAIQKFAPIFDKITGNYSMNFKFNTTLGESLLQILGGLTGEGVLKTDDVKVEGVETLNQLSSALKLSSNPLNSFSTKDINIPFKVDNGKVTTRPFSINIGNEGKLNLEGTTGLDQSINYKGTVTLPKSMSNNFIKDVGLIIGGTFTNPKISIDTKSLISNLAGTAATQILGGSVDDKKEELNQKLTEEKVKQAAKIRTEAKEASDKLVNEAKVQGQKLVDGAKNPIAKIAAQKASDVLVDEAKKQGQKLMNEADLQAKKLEVTE